MKYNVGDTVRIQPRERLAAHKKGTGMGKLPVCLEMLEYAGQITTIKSVYDDETYRLDIDGGKCWWDDWMFDPGYGADEPLSTVDAVMAMARDGKTLTSGGNDFWYSRERRFFLYKRTGAADHVMSSPVIEFPDKFYLRAEKEKRQMTLWEALDWASSEESLGWVVRSDADDDDNYGWHPPQYYSYDGNLASYQRARLLPDLSGVDESTIQGFEVEE
jgi:hypothetical protein